MTISSSTISLANGVEIPQLGLGVFQSKEGREVEDAVNWAFECGYRHIDTASIYGNEKGVGKAIEASGLNREEIFVTTKCWNEDQRQDRQKLAFDESLERLQLDYVDLYLVHWPVEGKYLETYKVLEEIYSEGRAKAIGVSNFLPHHLEDLMGHCEVVPMVNQFEHHAWLQQPRLSEICRENNIVIEAWAPIMKGKSAEDPALVEIGEKYGKGGVQVVLRWLLQNGVVAIPKSVNKDRIISNADIFDFELSADDMASIDAMDRSERLGADPNNFSF